MNQPSPYQGNNWIPFFQEMQDHIYPRPRLHMLFNQATQKPIVTLIAGAGYGKSVALSNYLLQKQTQTTWLSLTQMDNLIIRFWEHFSQTVRYNHPETAQKLLQIGFPENEIGFAQFCRILSEGFAGKPRQYLVIDDFFLLTNASILTFFEWFIQNPIQNLCIIIVSREDPPFPITSLLSKNLLFRIQQESLRLSKEEVSEFFKFKNILISAQAAAEFHTYTDGWVFATQLVCLSLKKGVFYQKNPLSAVRLDIYSLLNSEIFAPSPPELQQLLIKISLLESLPLDLLVPLAGGDQALAQQVLKISSFILFNSQTDTLRLHRLFLQFLKEKQSLLSQEEIVTIYLTAANWYAQNEYRLDAITYYEKIGHYEECADIILTFTARYPVDTIEFLLSSLDRMPQYLIAKRPLLRVLYAKYLLNNFRAQEAYLLLYEIVAQYKDEPLTPTHKSVLAEAYIMLGFQHMMTYSIFQNDSFVDYFRTASEYLPQGSTINSGLGLNCGTYICFVGHSDPGSFERLLQLTESWEPYCTSVLNGLGHGFSGIMRAEVCYFRRQIKDAEKYTYLAMAQAHAANQFDLENYCYFLLTRIATGSTSFAQISSLLEKQKNHVQTINYAEAYAVHDITLGWFYTQIERTDLLAPWLKDRDRCREVMSPITSGIDFLITAKYLLAEQKIYQLLALLNHNHAPFSSNSFLYCQIESLLLKSIALNLIKEPQQAAQAFQQAYELAMPNQIIQPFIENGKYTRTLIGQIAPHCSIPAQWLKDIQIKSSSYAKRISSIAAQHNALYLSDAEKSNLSKNETKILVGLCQGLTREEIADDSGISVNTVKTMIKIIYSKLGVNNNYDAVRVATLLGLLD